MPRIDRDDRVLMLRLASTAVLVGVLAAGCDTQTPEERDQWQGPYQLETAVVAAPPAKPEAVAARPASRLTEIVPPRTGRAAAVTAAPAPPSLALPVEAPSVPTGRIVLPPIVPSTTALPSIVPPTGVSEPEAPARLGTAILDPADRDVGLVTRQAPADAAYIPQISDSARTAYIVQVGAAASGQRMAVRAGDKVLGQVEFQVAEGQVSVRIGQVLDLFQDKMDGAKFAQLRASSAGGEFVSLDRIHAAGVPLHYNAAYDELTLETGRS